MADRMAHYASVYADHPKPNVLKIDNTAHGTNHTYRSGIDYSATASSQEESNSTWHSMMSDAEANGGMTHKQAMDRGLAFGWANIFSQQSSENIGNLGQGFHALQDAYAHEGASTDEHLGTNLSSSRMLWNDMYGNTSKAEIITKSALTVVGLFKGKTDGLSDGAQFDFSGMSKQQLKTVSDLFNKADFSLNAIKGSNGAFKINAIKAKPKLEQD